jgi:hypothetical protein
MIKSRGLVERPQLVVDLPQTCKRTAIQAALVVPLCYSLVLVSGRDNYS